MPRNRIPPPPGPGRPKGVPNKATRDIKEFSRKVLTDPAYVEALKVRLRRGTAGAVEIELYRHAYGQPKETKEVTGADGGPIVFCWQPLDPDPDAH